MLKYTAKQAHRKYQRRKVLYSETYMYNVYIKHYYK